MIIREQTKKERRKSTCTGCFYYKGKEFPENPCSKDEKCDLKINTIYVEKLTKKYRKRKPKPIVVPAEEVKSKVEE